MCTAITPVNFQTFSSSQREVSHSSPPSVFHCSPQPQLICLVLVVDTSSDWNQTTGGFLVTSFFHLAKCHKVHPRHKHVQSFLFFIAEQQPTSCTQHSWWSSQLRMTENDTATLTQVHTLQGRVFIFLSTSPGEGVLGMFQLWTLSPEEVPDHLQRSCITLLA